MRNIFNYGVLVLLLGTCIRISAQDPTFSNFNFNQAYYNPAYTGYYEGYNISVTSHTMWPNIPGKIFPGALSTNTAYGDAWINKGFYTAGAGVFATSDLEGEGFLRTNTFGVSYAQQLYLPGRNHSDPYRLKVSAGFKVYANSISIDWNKLTFSDQLNVDYVNANSAFGKEGIGHATTFDIDAGILLQTNTLDNNRNTSWHNEFGLALGHILSPATSFLGDPENATHIPRKLVLSYTSYIKLPNKHFFVMPTALFQKQSNFYEFDASLEVCYKLNEKDAGIPIGLTIGNRLSIAPAVSNTNAVVVGLSRKSTFGSKNPIVYYISFSVEFPYGGLGTAQTYGTYELSLGFVFPAKLNDHFGQCPSGAYDHSGTIKSWAKYN